MRVKRVFLDPVPPGKLGHVLLCPPSETFDGLLERASTLLGEHTTRLFVRAAGGYFQVTSVYMLQDDDVRYAASNECAAVLCSQLGDINWTPRSGTRAMPPSSATSLAEASSSRSDDGELALKLAHATSPGQALAASGAFTAAPATMEAVPEERLRAESVEPMPGWNSEMN
eukprot:2003404-Prymnesium_polylepis.1